MHIFICYRCSAFVSRFNVYFHTAQCTELRCMYVYAWICILCTVFIYSLLLFFLLFFLLILIVCIFSIRTFVFYYFSRFNFYHLLLFFFFRAVRLLVTFISVEINAWYGTVYLMQIYSFARSICRVFLLISF